MVWGNDNDTREDEELNNDQRTFRLLRIIADSIDPNIQWGKDTPSNHVSNKLPCLDMEVWWSQEDSMIYHEFYKKTMSSKYFILQRSAISESTKRNSFFQEGMRRLMNCSPNLSWSDKAGHLLSQTAC